MGLLLSASDTDAQGGWRPFLSIEQAQPRAVSSANREGTTPEEQEGAGPVRGLRHPAALGAGMYTPSPLPTGRGSSTPKLGHPCLAGLPSYLLLLLAHEPHQETKHAKSTAERGQLQGKWGRGGKGVWGSQEAALLPPGPWAP